MYIFISLELCFCYFESPPRSRDQAIGQNLGSLVLYHLKPSGREKGRDACYLIIGPLKNLKKLLARDKGITPV